MKTDCRSQEHRNAEGAMKLREILSNPKSARDMAKQIGDIISDIEPNGENNVYVLAFRIIEEDSKFTQIRNDVLEDIMNARDPGLAEKRIHVLHVYREINHLLEKLHADLKAKED